MYDVPRANAVDAVSDHPSSIGPYHCGYEGSEDSWIDGRSVVLFDVSVVAEDVKEVKPSAIGLPCGWGVGVF